MLTSLLPTALRPHEGRRDWRRVWRDPPGFFRGNPCDCKCSSTASSSAAVITGCCCPVFPAVVHVTFSNSGWCNEIDGMTFALTYGNPAFPLQTCVWTLTLPIECNSITGLPPPFNPPASKIGFSCAGGTHSGNLEYVWCTGISNNQQILWSSSNIGSGSTCSPLNFAFPSSVIPPRSAYGCSCCGLTVPRTGPSATVTL